MKWIKSKLNQVETVSKRRRTRTSVAENESAAAVLWMYYWAVSDLNMFVTALDWPKGRCGNEYF